MTCFNIAPSPAALIDRTIEIRTKSSNYSAIRDIPAVSNAVLAWTLSPAEIIAACEHQTASLEARLAALRQAMSDGWRVRVCIDPVLLVDNWRELYGALTDKIGAEIDAASLHDISVGAFRINTLFLERIRAQRAGPPLLFHPFESIGSFSTYKQPDLQSLFDFFSLRLRAAGIPAEKIMINPLQAAAGVQQAAEISS